MLIISNLSNLAFCTNLFQVTKEHITKRGVNISFDQVKSHPNGTEMIKQFVKVYSDAGLTPSEEYFKEHEYLREYFQPTAIMQSSSSTMLTTTREKYNALVRSHWKPEIIGTSSGERSLKSRYKPPQVSVGNLLKWCCLTFRLRQVRVILFRR